MLIKSEKDERLSMYIYTTRFIVIIYKHSVYIRYMYNFGGDYRDVRQIIK